MKALIIEDERPIAMALADSLRTLRPGIEIAAVTTSVGDSLDAITANPDLDIIFSDIRLDDGLSFSIFDRARTDAMVVFTTAFDEYALRAFDYNCVDYLIKPVSRDALERALERCETRWPRAGMDAVRAVSEEIREGRALHRKRIFLEQGTDTLIVNVSDICYVVTEKGNTRVFLSDGSWGATDLSLLELSQDLPALQFCRVSRQAIVNIDYIHKMTPGPGRDSEVVMKAPYSDVRLQITQERKKELMAIVSGPGR